MYPLFESIKVLDGEVLNLSWHQERLNRSYFELFGKQTPFLLENLIRIPHEARQGIVKARFQYNQMEWKSEFLPYMPKKIQRLRIVRPPAIDYSLKYTDRKALASALDGVSEGEEIIIIQDGRITDSSYSNLIFKSGDTWFTPDTPLLAGTCRARLLAENKINAIPMREEDLEDFSAVKLINAMLGPEDTEEILLR